MKASRLSWPTSLNGRLVGSFSLIFITLFVGVKWVELKGIPYLFPGGIVLEKQRAIAALAWIADSRKERLENRIAQHRGNLESFAASSAVAASVARTLRNDSGNRDLRRQLTLLSRGSGAIKEISVADVRTGRTLATTAPGEKQDPEKHLSLTRRIYGPNGDPLALVVMNLEIAVLIEPLLRSSSWANGTELLMLDGRGRSLSRLKHSLPDGTIVHPHRTAIPSHAASLAVAGDNGFLETHDYRENPVAAAYRHIRIDDKRGWGLVVKRDQRDIQSHHRRSAALFTLAGLLGLTAAIVFIQWISSRLCRPIHEISQAVVELAAGHLETRVPENEIEHAGSGNCEELGGLAVSFNTMAQRIQDREQELKDLNDELESFSHSVSHDLRAPLRSVDGFSLALLEDFGDKLGTKGKQQIHRIRSASHRMEGLINDLLDLSSITRGKIEPTNVDLSALAQEVTDRLAASSNRTIACTIEPRLTAKCDRHLMRIVLENLFSNAWKFTRKTPQPLVQFGSETISGGSAFFVRDNGAGFDTRRSAEVFNVFQRLHGREEFEGTGVGLATVQRIIRRHGGWIWAKSTSGQGAAFYFIL